jgi:predicted nucleic acid-binding Zn ribbon protein
MNCIVCNSEFELPELGGWNKKTCSPDCKKINDAEKKRQSHLRLKEAKHNLLVSLSNEWQVPQYLILQYGIEFLKSNPHVVEVLQIQTKLSGKFTFLSEEEKLIRRKAIERQSNLRFREGLTPKIYICKVCSGQFSKSGSQRENNRVTCGDVCSKELNRIQTNEAGRRQREKKKALKLLIEKD